MVVESKGSDPIASLREALRQAEAELQPIQKQYFEKKHQVESLQKALYEYVPKAGKRPKFVGVDAGPAKNARQYLQEAGEPRPFTMVIDALYQRYAHYQVMEHGMVYLERSVKRSCTAGTILYFTGDRIGLPEHAMDKQWKNQVDWAEIKKRGFKPHHMQKDHLAELLPADILKKLLSFSRV